MFSLKSLNVGIISKMNSNSIHLIKLSLHYNFEVKFVRRIANMIAHALARATCFWISHRIFYSYLFYIKHWLINNNS